MASLRSVLSPAIEFALRITYLHPRRRENVRIGQVGIDPVHRDQAADRMSPVRDPGRPRVCGARCARYRRTVDEPHVAQGSARPRDDGRPGPPRRSYARGPRNGDAHVPRDTGSLPPALPESTVKAAVNVAAPVRVTVVEALAAFPMVALAAPLVTVQPEKLYPEAGVAARVVELRNSSSRSPRLPPRFRPPTRSLPRRDSGLRSGPRSAG